jgi:predicted lipid-binding transport protein (Tim44 family)
MADLPLDPFALLSKSQKMALDAANGALDALVSVGRTAAQPDEAVRQIAALANAVGDLASASVQPLQDFVIKQREIADTLANLATVQADLAVLVESLAHGHAGLVQSLETLTAPVFSRVVREQQGPAAK